MTTSQSVRRVAPYCNPYLAGLAPRGPEHDLPSQGRPPSAPEPDPRADGHRCRLTLNIDGRDYRVRVEFLERAGGPPLHVVDLRALDLKVPGEERESFRVFFDPDDGPTCPCPEWREMTGCLHANACAAAGLFPELAIVVSDAGGV